MKSIRRMMPQVRAMFSGKHTDAEMERELAAHLSLLSGLLIESRLLGQVTRAYGQIAGSGRYC